MTYLCHYASPLGGITIASGGAALTGLWFDGQKYFGSTLSGERQVKELPVFEKTRRWLDAYFRGEKPDFTPPLSVETTPFRRAVWELLLTIPYGQTMTYGEIAAEIARRRGLSGMSAPGSGRRSGAQPNFADHPLPPRGGHRRKSDGLCGRHREEGQAAGAGAYGYARVIRALTGDGGISQPHDPQPDASRKPGAESICFSPRLFRLWIRRVVKRIIEMFIPLRP